MVTTIAIILFSFGTILGTSRCEDLTFPPGFKFGAATSAYQVEGAWNVSDKGESIWDRFTHTRPYDILDGSNGDIACDSYHKWREDVQLAKNLGLHFYRISISWPRLLPSGFANHISEDGARYYSNLLDELLNNGIEPIVTLYHWELPQSLQDLGGWTNPLIVDWFADYIRVVYSLYADRVKTWITINEGLVVCDFSYGGNFALGIKDTDHAPYLCNKYLLLAHAKAYRMYDEEFKPIYNGRVSLTNVITWYVPNSESPKDVEIAELAMQYSVGRFTHPILSAEGGWPPAVEKVMAENSAHEGYSHSRLPAFSQEEIEYIKGTYDFLGINEYTSRVVKLAEPGEEIGTWPLHGSKELGITISVHPDWMKIPTVSWLYVHPEGLRRSMYWIQQRYGNVSILITENGFSTSDSGLDDQSRVDYHRKNLEQVLLSIKEDKINVEGYIAWTLIDNFEWNEGYTTKFGLYRVDFDDPERTRTPRLSAHFYKQVIEKYSLVEYQRYDKHSALSEGS